MRNIIIALFSASLLGGCSSPKAGSTEEAIGESKEKIIFETDMGNDVDDALALDMLYKYVDMGQVELLGVMSNKNSKYSAEFIDVMGTWYGHPDIPVGVVKNGTDSENDAKNYVKAVCQLEEEGDPLFKRTLKNHAALPEAPVLYRKILSKQPDSSVTVVSVGFSTNIARLLDTPADEYSPLTGKELVAKKVKLLSIMAGSFASDPFKEYNVVKDIPAAKKVFAEWPTPVVASPFEVGIRIRYPGESIENDFHWGMPHPLVEAYKAYRPMPYDRPTWDLTSVLYAVQPDTAFFKQSEKGIIAVDDEGYTHFEPNSGGDHLYLSVSEQQAEKVKNYFVDLITQKPARYKD